MKKIRILQVADLHLEKGENCAQGLSILEEIVDLANEKEVDYLLLCGDIFNSFPDAESLRGDFRSRLEVCRAEIFYIPGNHEELYRPENKQLSRLDFGKVQLLAEIPFVFIERPGVEFLAVPHQRRLASYREWEIPPRSPGKRRILLAHGLVTEFLAYTGPVEEEKDSVLDPALFHYCEADYAALGHIHRRMSLDMAGARVAYSGSSRVWKRGESGPRGALYLECAVDGITEETFLELKKAGEYRYYEVPLQPDGTIPDISAISEEWTGADFVHLRLSGVIENESEFSTEVERLQRRLSGLVGRILLEREDVIVTQDIAMNSLLHDFHEEWKKLEPVGSDEAERRVWLRARELAFKSVLER